jgi:FMN phosphatase YigB (HAD superfamily)
MLDIILRKGSAAMLRAVFFDLDNTLIFFDEGKFYEGLIKRMAGRFADLMGLSQVRDSLIDATRSLRRADGRRNNAERFMDVFAAGREHLRGELWARLRAFYAEDYGRLPVAVTRPTGLGDVFRQLAGLQLKLVVATNPIFPLEAQQQRLGWAGLEAAAFDLITHIENMYFCKPQTEYYRQICDMVGEAPEACLMVGNDALNDMAAAAIGVKAYLAEDAAASEPVWVRSGGLPQAAKPSLPDYRGPLSSVPQVVRELGAVLRDK